MGCSGSQPAQDNNVNANEAIIISKENSANGTSDHMEPVITDGIEATVNSLQDSNGVVSPQGNHKAVNRAVKGNSLKRSRTRRPSDGKFGIENAWDVTKIKKNQLENVVTRPAQAELADLESEYGKDGVDLASSRVHSSEQDAENLMGSSPDGTFDYSERMSKQRSIRKEDSDETFDPSALIDIEKFKAANAPAIKTLTSNKDTETSKIEPDENHNEYNQYNTTNHAYTEVVVSPSNYNAFYDDDEKQLIDSIENDFKTTLPFALPGSVL